LDLRGRKQQDAKENDIVRNFMVFINHEILFGFLRARLLGWTDYSMMLMEKTRNVTKLRFQTVKIR
jgi:hypothetical protein